MARNNKELVSKTEEVMAKKLLFHEELKKMKTKRKMVKGNTEHNLRISPLIKPDQNKLPKSPVIEPNSKKR